MSDSQPQPPAPTRTARIVGALVVLSLLAVGAWVLRSRAWVPWFGGGEPTAEISKIAPTPRPTSTPAPPTATPWQTPFDQYVAGLGVPPEVALVNNMSELANDYAQSIDYASGTRESCQTRRFLFEKSLEDFLVLDPNLGELYPGAMIQSAPLIRDGLLQRIDLPRGAATLTISGLPLDRLSASVEPATPANVLEAINNLLPTTPTVPVADIAWEIVTIKSAEQAALEIGLRPTWQAVLGTVSIDPGGRTTSAIVRLVQTYYTVTFVPPQQPSDGFAPLSLAAAVENMAPDNPPAYISSVSYGRYLLMIATTQVEPRKFEAALALTLNNNVVRPGYSRAELEEAWRETSLKVIAKGGAADDALALIAGGDLMAFVEGGGRVSAESRGVPIAWRGAYLHNHQPIRVANSVTFDEVLCDNQPLPQSALLLTLDDLCVRSTGSRLNRTADVYFSISGQVSDQPPVVIEQIAANAPLQLRRDADCAQPYRFNAAQRFTLPSRNGSCLALDGTFYDSDLLADAFVGSVRDQFCYRNGVWIDATGAPIGAGRQYSNVLVGSNAEWRVRYRVQDLTR